MTQYAENLLGMYRGNDAEEILKDITTQPEPAVRELMFHFGCKDIGELACKISNL